MLFYAQNPQSQDPKYFFSHSFKPAFLLHILPGLYFGQDSQYEHGQQHLSNGDKRFIFLYCAQKHLHPRLQSTDTTKRAAMGWKTTGKGKLLKATKRLLQI